MIRLYYFIILSNHYLIIDTDNYRNTDNAYLVTEVSNVGSTILVTKKSFNLFIKGYV